MKQKIEQIKHKSLPYSETVKMEDILNKKVLAKDGKKLGKIRSIQINPNTLTIEGILVDTGMFDIDQYFDKNYIGVLNTEGAVLKIVPSTEIVNLKVYDSNGKEVGKVLEVQRSKLTNKLISIRISSDNYIDGTVVTADYITTIGDSVMLKEPFEEAIREK